jgi:hypothetical protein
MSRFARKSRQLCQIVAASLWTLNLAGSSPNTMVPPMSASHSKDRSEVDNDDVIVLHDPIRRIAFIRSQAVGPDLTRRLCQYLRTPYNSFARSLSELFIADSVTPGTIRPRARASDNRFGVGLCRKQCSDSFVLRPLNWHSASASRQWWSCPSDGPEGDESRLYDTGDGKRVAQ